MSNTRAISILNEVPEFIFGAEEGTEGTPAGDTDSQSGESSGESGESAGSASQDSQEQDPAAGLKSALDKERKRAAAAEKELKKFQKQQEDAKLAEKSEVEQANTKLQNAQSALDKLKAGYLRTKVDAAIREAAREANFIDVEDALAGVDRSALEVEQDDADPSLVTLDEKSIKAAVKALATKKPHFLKASGTDDGEPTGSPMGNRQKKRAGDEVYFENYPSLRS